MSDVETTGRWSLPLVARCSESGSRCTGTGERYVDPYESDVNGRTILRYLCENCLQDICDEI